MRCELLLHTAASTEHRLRSRARSQGTPAQVLCTMQLDTSGRMDIYSPRSRQAQSCCPYLHRRSRMCGVVRCAALDGSEPPVPQVHYESQPKLIKLMLWRMGVDSARSLTCKRRTCTGARACVEWSGAQPWTAGSRLPCSPWSRRVSPSGWATRGAAPQQAPACLLRLDQISCQLKLDI